MEENERKKVNSFYTAIRSLWGKRAHECHHETIITLVSIQDQTTSGPIQNTNQKQNLLQKYLSLHN